MDDVSILGRKEKAWFISFASLPLLISQIGNSKIDFLLFDVNFTGANLDLIYWLIIVPFGITCCARFQIFCPLFKEKPSFLLI